MSLNLPERASYEYLKKLAKDRLAFMREKNNPNAKLAEAQLAIAREYGFSNWRALKAEMDLRRAPNVAEFMRACAAGDLDTLRDLLQKIVLRHSIRHSGNASSVRREVHRILPLANSKCGSTKTSMPHSTEGVSSAFEISTAFH